jgi:hypothetical protein
MTNEQNEQTDQPEQRLPSQATLSELIGAVKTHGAPGYATHELFGEHGPDGVSGDDTNRVLTLTRIEEPNGSDGPRIITNYSVTKIPDGLHVDKSVSTWGAEFFDPIPMKATDENLGLLGAQVEDIDEGKRADDTLGLSIVTEEEVRGMIDEITGVVSKNTVPSTAHMSASGHHQQRTTVLETEGNESSGRAARSVARRLGKLIRRSP